MGVTTSTANAGATYVPLMTTTVGSATPSVSLSSIPSTYTDLVLVITSRTTNSTSSRLNGNFNADIGGSNYSYTRLNGDGSAASSDRVSNFGIMDFGYFPASSTGRFAQSKINIQSYSNASVNKTSLVRFDDAGAITQAIVPLWRSTVAISTIVLSFTAGNIDAGSTFTLYGIKAA